MSPRPLFPPVFAPEHSHPLVDDFSLRASRLQARQQPQGVPPVYPMPLREHPMWSGNNEIGAESKFAPDANNRQMVLKLGEWGPPTQWSIALGLAYDRIRTPNPSFAVTAEIQFGVGGTVQQLECDWRQGTVVPLVANTVIVNAAFDFPNGISSFSVPPDLVLRATACQMPPCHSRVSRTYYTDWPATESAVEVPIPPFAQRFEVGFSPAPVSLFLSYTNTFVTFTGAASIAYQGTQLLSFFDITNQQLGAPQLLPIPEGARNLRMLWAPGGVPGLPPFNSRFMTRYEIGL